MANEISPRGIRMNAELVIAVSAVVISVLTAIVSAYQTKIMREQQYSSVWPYVQWDMTIDSKEFNIRVLNKGVGPAIIKSSSLTLDGNQVTSLEYLKNLMGRLDSVNVYHSSVDSTVISPGESVYLFRVLASQNLNRIPENAYHRTRFQIVYSDIYSSCWVSNGNKVIEASCD